MATAMLIDLHEAIVAVEVRRLGTTMTDEALRLKPKLDRHQVGGKIEIDKIGREVHRFRRRMDTISLHVRTIFQLDLMRCLALRSP